MIPAEYEAILQQGIQSAYDSKSLLTAWGTFLQTQHVTFVPQLWQFLFPRFSVHPAFCV